MLTYPTVWCNEDKLITLWQIFKHISACCHNKAFYVNKYPWGNKRLDLKIAFWDKFLYQYTQHGHTLTPKGEKNGTNVWCHALKILKINQFCEMLRRLNAILTHPGASSQECWVPSAPHMLAFSKLRWKIIIQWTKGIWIKLYSSTCP